MAQKNNKNTPTELNQQSMQYLGLNKQPFADEILSDDNFFRNQSLDKIIESLTHQAQFSDLMLIVEGPHGSGKTALFRQFIQQELSNTKILSVQAEATDTLVQIQQKMSLHLQDLGDANHLDDNLKSLQMFDQIPLLTMDNSHVLSDITLQELLRYQQELKQGEVNLKILLFANSGMSETLQNISELQADQMYVQTIPNYLPKQIENFLFHRLRQAGYNDEPLLDEKSIQQIIKKASPSLKGYMIEAVTLVEKIVEKKLKPAAPAWLKIVAGAVILLIIIAAIFYFIPLKNLLPDATTPLDDNLANKLDTNLSESPNNGDLNNETATTPADRQSSLYLEKPLVAPHIDGTAIDDNPVDSSASIEPVDIQQDNRPLDTQTRSATALTVPQPPVTEKSPVDNNIPSITPIEPSASGIPAPTPDPAAQNTITPATISQPPIKPNTTAALKQADTQAEKTPEPVQAVKTPAPAPRPPAPLHPALQQLGIMGITSNDWIKQQTPSHWTLQLLGARDPETLLKFARRHRLSRHTAWYKTWLTARPYYVLIHGSYPSRDAARNAIAQLPAALKSNKPWVKSMAAAQKAAH